MPSLRDLGLDPMPATESPKTLRDLGLVPAVAPDTTTFQDQADAAGMSQLRRGFVSGRYNTDANALATDMSGLRARGRTVEADELNRQIGALQRRAATFAPTEQDVTKLDWQPGRILDYGLGAMGQGAASMLDPVAAAAGLNTAGALIGKIDSKPAQLTGAALRAAAPATAFGLNYRQSKGEFVRAADQDPELLRTRTPQEIDTAGTFSGVGSGLLDTVTQAAFARRLAGSGTATPLRSFGVTGRTAGDVAAEAGTELAQGELKRATLGYLNPLRDTSGDAADRWNDLAGGAFGALPFSAASNLAAKGYERRGVQDDPSDDLTIKPGKSADDLTKELLDRAKLRGLEDEANSWNEVLRGQTNSGDLMKDVADQHAALLKELGGRAEKGDATAAQFAQQLGAMSPDADPVGWLETPLREQAYTHLMGDGSDLGKIIEAYKGRRRSAQRGTIAPEQALTADIFTKALPQVEGKENVDALTRAAQDLAGDLVGLATVRGGKLAGQAAVMDLADRMADLYGPQAPAVLARVAMASGVEKAPLFKDLQKNLSTIGNMAEWRRTQRTARVAAAEQLVRLVPAEAQLKLRKAGLDLTTPAGKLALLDKVQDGVRAAAFGVADKPNKEVMARYAKVFGEDATRKMFALVAPGKVVERDTSSTKLSGGTKTEATESDELTQAGADLAAGEVDDMDASDWDVKNALGRMEEAPGAKMFVFKGRGVEGVSKDRPHPFVADKKTRNLPTLVGLYDADSDGTNSLERMKAKAYEGMGGGYGNLVSEMKRGADGRTVRENLPANAIRPDDNDPSALGVGSYRIRTVSAAEVMNDLNVPPKRRRDLMIEYARKDGLDGDVTPQSLQEKLGIKLPADAPVEQMVDAYFSNKYLVTVEQMAEKDQLRPTVAEVKEMMRRGAEYRDYSKKLSGEGTANDITLSLIRFASPSAPSKDGVAVVRAGDLVRWVFENRNDYKKKDYNSFEARAIEYRDALMEGIGALAAEGHMAELPYVVNLQGKKESFEGGFPPSLKLGSMTQAEIDGKRKARAKHQTPFVGPPDIDAVAREQAEERRPGNTNPDELLSEGQQATVPGAKRGTSVKLQFWDEPTGTPSQDATYAADVRRAGELADPELNPDGSPKTVIGPAAKPGKRYDTRRSGRFVVEPETADTRRPDNRVPSEAEPREQRSGVPTDRTDLAQRTSPLLANRPLPEAMSPANAMAVGRRTANELWFEFVRGADPRSAFLRLKRIAAAMGRPESAGKRTVDQVKGADGKFTTKVLDEGLAGGPHYVAAVAPLLTPERVAALVRTASNPGKAQAMLDDMRQAAARALLHKGNKLERFSKVALARQLLGDDKLPSAQMEKALKALLEGPGARRSAPQAPAEAQVAAPAPKPAQDRAAKTARVDEIVLSERWPAGVPETRAFLNAAKARLAELEQARVDNDYENLSVDQEDALMALRALFAPGSDLTTLYTENDEFLVLPKAEQDKYLAHARGLMDNGVRKNSMRGQALRGVSQEVAKAQELTRLFGFKSAPPQLAAVAAKLLTDPRIAPERFMQEAAEALSYIVMAGEGGEAIRNALKGDAWRAMRVKIAADLIQKGTKRGDALVESYRVLTEMALRDELQAKTPNERSFIRAVKDFVLKLLGAVKEISEADKFRDVVRQQLNAAIENAAGPVKLKEGYAKVTFQQAVDGDPQAARVLVHMAQNPNISLTGSIVLAHAGTIYRDAKNMLHDLDLIVRGSKEDAERHLKAGFPDAVQVYDFSTSNGKVDTYVVPPVGATVANVTRQFGDKGKLMSFSVMRDGKEVGRTWNDDKGEHKTGETGTLVDLFTDTNEEAESTIPFTFEGKQLGVKAVSPASIFNAKLSIGREKDLVDYARYEPKAGVRLNAQQAAAPMPSDEDIAKAKAYVAKVLGPQIKVEFTADMGHAGEWVDAEQTIKLATATGPGVLSVAYHEAMHGFWSRYARENPKVAAVLAKAASSPRMLQRLQAMLHDEPDALAQIADGAPHAQEERVAYMYQFWAAGELDVDKPATTLFAKFRKFLRKVFGMVRDSETALDLMTAFHDGKMAEPSAAGRVLDGIMKDRTWNEDIKRKFDRSLQGIYTTIAPSNLVMRNEKLSPTARMLGRVFFSNPGEEKAGGSEGYLNARRRITSQYTNYLYDAVKGLSNRDLEAAAKELQLKTPLNKIPYAPVREAVKAVRALTKRYYNYATQPQDEGGPGLNLKFLDEDHYPRVWSMNALIEEGGKDKFIAMLLHPKYEKTMARAVEFANAGQKQQLYDARAVAEQMYVHLIDRTGVDEKGLGTDDILTPFFASQKERSFEWLDKEDVEPFLEKDLIGAMSRYLHQGVRTAEFARRFGNTGERLKEFIAMRGDEWVNPDTGATEPRPEHGRIAREMEDSLKADGVTGDEAGKIIARHMEDIRNAIQAHEGSLGKEISPDWRKFTSLAMVYQNLRLLPLSLFAAFGDTVGIAARGGGAKAAFDAFVQGLKDVYARWKMAASDELPDRSDKSLWEGLAETIGAVDSHMFLEQMGKAHTSEFMTDFARRANRALFMANGLTAWDRSMRVSATKAAVGFLERHSKLVDTQHSARWLKELGLTAADVPLDASGKLITDRHVLAAEKGIPIEDATKQMEKVHRALTRWVEGAVLTPNAAQRPTWSSDPHWAVFFHLKQFTYSFHDTVLRRAYNEAKNGNMTPIAALGAAVPVMIASDIFKGLIKGGGDLPDYAKGWDLGDWMLHGAERAGLAGIAQIGIDALDNPVGTLGPTVDHAVKAAGGVLTGDLLGTVKDAIPGVRMIDGLPDMRVAL